jgi:hypothetical protein
VADYRLEDAGERRDSLEGAIARSRQDLSTGAACVERVMGGRRGVAREPQRASDYFPIRLRNSVIQLGDTIN